MSEYQRYEFMTIDRPLTRAQLDAVEDLSSHIEASSTHALIEYNWGDFKHDPIKVLHKYFDGFLYWANWGSPQLAFRFPHGVLPADLIEGYDFDDDFVTFTQHKDYDILDIQYGEMEPPDEWVEYDLGSLIAIREELMEGDQRSLYVVWLANQHMEGGYDREGDDAEEDYEINIPPVPPGLSKWTAAHQALAELFQVPSELLAAAARHSSAAESSPGDNFAAWVDLLPQERRKDYLVRLAKNEPGLSRLLVKELRELGLGKVKATPAIGERVAYAQLLAESKAVKAQLERERREQERQARLRHLQDIHDHKNTFWQQADKAAARGTSAGYDEATRLLGDLRAAAGQFNEVSDFEARFKAWVPPHLRRPALIRRLRERDLPLPE